MISEPMSESKAARLLEPSPDHRSKELHGTFSTQEDGLRNSKAMWYNLRAWYNVMYESEDLPSPTRVPDTKRLGPGGTRHLKAGTWQLAVGQVSGARLLVSWTCTLLPVPSTRYLVPWQVVPGTRELTMYRDPAPRSTSVPQAPGPRGKFFIGHKP